MISLPSHRWATVTDALVGLLLLTALTTTTTTTASSSSSSLRSSIDRTTTKVSNHGLQNSLSSLSLSLSSSSSSTILAIAQEAAADANTQYEDLLQEYTNAGCLESWLPFPTTDAIAVPATATATTMAAIYDSSRDKDGSSMICMCGLLHDLAASAAGLLRFLAADDVSASYASASDSSTGKGDTDFGIGRGPSNFDTETVTSSSSSSTTTITALDAWIMARTSNRQQQVIPCVDGIAAGYYCNNVDLVAKLSLQDFVAPSTGNPPKRCSDVWGWTSSSSSDRSNDREFVLWGVSEGHYFFEVTGLGSSTTTTNDNNNPELLGFLPSTTGAGSIWHDVKVIGDFAYLGAEISGHGMQIFDLRRLLTIDPSRDCQNDRYCQTLGWDKVYTGTSTYPISATHNVVVNNDNNNDANSNNRDYVYMVGGGNGCNGGLHIVDVTNPRDPTFVACFADTGYVHDAQCVNYKGPDPNYNNGKGENADVTEICVCFASNKVAIVDVTDKSDIRILSDFVYNKVGYVHQGWLSSDHRHIVFGDEADETSGDVLRTRTLVVNIESLESPGVVKEFLGTTAAIDHNQYVAKINKSTRTVDIDNNNRKNNKNKNHVDVIYQSNYEAGLGLLQVMDYETANFIEVAYFDTYPLSTSPNFNGAWSVFPYFRSGLVAISSVGEGLFLVRPNLEAALDLPPLPPTATPKPDPDNDTGAGADDDDGKCKNGDIAINNKPRKDCEWVGKKKAKKRCKALWNGEKVSKTCLQTCGMVGVGRCRNYYRKQAGKTTKRQKAKARARRKRDNTSDSESLLAL